ncbi:MAG: putative sigma-54 modulation protein [Cocleimonas sp.]|jgi:putative sigma-54 modulation protein
METVIQSQDFTLTEALKSFIKEHARKSMNSCSNHIKKINIHLKDINGPKGGEDKECCVEVQLANHAPIVVVKRSSDAYQSIRNALSRASRITLRKVGKRRTMKSDPRFAYNPKHESKIDQISINKSFYKPEN